MSLCQSKGEFSCGACCGLFNLKLDKQGYEDILKQRTEIFEDEVNYSVPWTIAEFRRKREEIEKEILKKDDTIYNCPYLGYIDQNRKRIGCMIHPNRTGNPKSQNFSFYGTSICQGYNCKNIERPTKPAWKKFFDKQDYNSLIYSKIASDHIFIDRLEDFFSSLGKDIETVILEEEQFLKRIFQYKIEKDANPNKTSFEIDMEVDKVGREWELLVIELGLREDEEIYRGLLEKKGRAE